MQLLSKIALLFIVIVLVFACTPDCYNNEEYFPLTEEQARKFPKRYSMGDPITFVYTDSVNTDTVVFAGYKVETYFSETVDDPPVCDSWLSELIISEMKASDHMLTLEINAENGGQFYITADKIGIYFPLNEISSSLNDKEYLFVNRYDTVTADLTYNTEHGIERIYLHKQKIEWRRLP